jgi:hypothetical protein
MSKPSLPYEKATSGKRALAEIEKVLKAFGASKYGSMEDFETGDLLVQFTYRQHNVSLRASGKGYAARWLREHPYQPLMRKTRQQHEQQALEIGRVARYSILREWIKGQITAVETGIFSFEAAFLGQIMLPSGETVMERVAQDKLLSIAPPTH